MGPIRALFADEISTGLDSNTTYQVRPKATPSLKGNGVARAARSLCRPSCRPNLPMRRCPPTVRAVDQSLHPFHQWISLSMLHSFIHSFIHSLPSLQIMRALRNFTHVMKIACVVGLLQPQPEAFELFDDCILLSNGKVRCRSPHRKGLCAARQPPGLLASLSAGLHLASSA